MFPTPFTTQAAGKRFSEKYEIPKNDRFLSKRGVFGAVKPSLPCRNPFFDRFPARSAGFDHVRHRRQGAG
jgi:hypothetical protein